MSFLTAWGVELPVKNDIVRASVDYVGQVRDTWMGGVSGQRKGVRDSWEMTLCGLSLKEALFWRMVFSGQGTSIPFASIGGSGPTTFFTAGTRGPNLTAGTWTRTNLALEPPPGFSTMLMATVQSTLIFDCLFDPTQYTMIYNNNGTYGAHWEGDATGTAGNFSTGIYFVGDKLYIVGGQVVSDLLWFPMVIPEDITEKIVAYGNAGNAISGFEKIPMAGAHFKDKKKWQIPYSDVTKLEPINAVAEFYEVSVKFGDFEV